MIADRFSKPYDPVKHKPFAMRLLGLTESVNGWALNELHNNNNERGNRNEQDQGTKGDKKRVSFCPLLINQLAKKEQQKAKTNKDKSAATSAKK